MKSSIAALCVAVGSALSLTGCGTVDNMCLANEETGRIPLHVYGGLEADLNYLTDTSDKPRRGETASADPLKLIYLADLPLSFAADTITLPVTLPLAFSDRSPAHPGMPKGGKGLWPSSSDSPPLLQTQPPGTNAAANPSLPSTPADR